jgi:hypothetical protein
MQLKKEVREIKEQLKRIQITLDKLTLTF